MGTNSFMLRLKAIDEGLNTFLREFEDDFDYIELEKNVKWESKFDSRLHKN